MTTFKELNLTYGQEDKKANDDVQVFILEKYIDFFFWVKEKKEKEDTRVDETIRGLKNYIKRAKT